MRDRSYNPKKREDGPSMLVMTQFRKRGRRTTKFYFVNVDSINDPAFGCRIRARRLQKGLSRQALANKSCADSAQIRLAERQPWDVPIGILSAICEVLGITFDDLSETTSIELAGTPEWQE